MFFAERVQQIIRGFNNDWKKALETINQEVMRAFTNFKNGTQILQVCPYPTHVQCVQYTALAGLLDPGEEKCKPSHNGLLLSSDSWCVCVGREKKRVSARLRVCICFVRA